jgi:hypothetical protein
VVEEEKGNRHGVVVNTHDTEYRGLFVWGKEGKYVGRGDYKHHVQCDQDNDAKCHESG